MTHRQASISQVYRLPNCRCAIEVAVSRSRYRGRGIEVAVSRLRYRGCGIEVAVSRLRYRGCGIEVYRGF